MVRLLCVLVGAAATLLAGAAAAAPLRPGAGLDQTLTVPATNGTGAVSAPLDPTHAYTITVSGTEAFHTGPPEGDALYGFLGKITGPDAILRVNQEGESILDLGSCPTLTLPYSSSHTYQVRVTGLSGALHFFFADNYFGDNSGGVTVTIHDLGATSAHCVATVRFAVSQHGAPYDNHSLSTETTGSGVLTGTHTSPLKAHITKLAPAGASTIVYRIGKAPATTQITMRVDVAYLDWRVLKKPILELGGSVSQSTTASCPRSHPVSATISQGSALDVSFCHEQHSYVLGRPGGAALRLSFTVVDRPVG